MQQRSGHVRDVNKPRAQAHMAVVLHPFCKNEKHAITGTKASLPQFCPSQILRFLISVSNRDPATVANALTSGCSRCRVFGRVHAAVSSDDSLLQP